MEHLNSFSGGMNKDLAKTLFKQGVYVDAQNFSLVTDVGLSTGSLRNIKGNELFFTIPDCSEVWTITNLDLTVTSQVSITVSGSTGTYSQSYTPLSLYDLGVQLSSDSTLSTLGYVVAYNDNRITIYGGYKNSTLLVNGITVTSNFNNLTVTLVSTGIAGSNCKIMGWCTLRDQIIILTAQSDSATPVAQSGQIWKVTYDKYLFNTVITLVYNNLLNFSLAHPVPNPGGIIGNYETPLIQKVYWTDNYNKPVSINIADPNVMAILPENLESVANILRGVATVHDVLPSGNIKTGIYQVSARLTQSSGTTSTFLTPSNTVTVVAELETVKYEQYEARDTGVSTSKSIRGKLYNLDSEYDRVEPVILYRQNIYATPDIYVLPSELIPNNGEYSFTFSGNETQIPLSLDEFLTENIVFETVKTLASKNNILFYGNVKYKDFDVNFDTRAYRFTGINSNTSPTSPRTAVVKDAAGNTTNIDPNTWTLAKKADAIQDINMQAPNSANNYLFQSDGQTFGGEGPNVSYEFVPMYVVNDTTINSPYRTVIDDSNTATGASLQTPYASVTATTKQVSLSQDIIQPAYSEVNQSLSYPNAAGPYSSYTTRGYQRDEMYRFGIVFYSKKGQPSYVHWIADIRMPKVYMPSTSASDPVNSDYLAFPISSIDNPAYSNNYNPDSLDILNESGVAYGNNLGIKFTVKNLDTISDLISGYSIVRVKREDNDKTVLGQGIFNPIWYSIVGNDQNNYFAVSAAENWSSQNSLSFGNLEANFGTLASPEFLFKGSPSYSVLDEIDIIQKNSQFQYFTIRDSTGGCANSTSAKLYTPTNFQTYAPKSKKTNATICYTYPLTPGAHYTNGAAGISTTLYNFGWRGSGSGDVEKDCSSCPDHISYSGDDWVSRSLGGSRLFLSFGFCSTGTSLNDVATGATWTNWRNLLFEDKIVNQNVNATYVYLANYKRPSTVQYGGNTFSERSYNEYISTGHIQVVNNTTYSHSDMVFGGDTYITLFDYAEQLRNPALNEYDGTGSNDPTTRYSKTRNVLHLIPVECSFPIELRKQNSKPSGSTETGYASTPRCAPNKSAAYADLPGYLGPPSTGNNAPTSTNPTTAEFKEVFEIDLDYFADNDIVKFFPSPEPYNFQDKFDVRVHRSEIKTNGELSDSWGAFKSENYIDVDTSQGELNNLIVYQNLLVGFQDRGIVMLSVKDKAISPDVSGSEIILGTGGILENYQYISKIIGSKHQFSFTTSHDSIFWFDINTKNIYKLTATAASGSTSYMPVAATVAKGLTSYMNKNINGLIQVNDNPYLNRGVTSTYDFRYNEAIMTFKDSVPDLSISARIIYDTVNSVTGYYEFTLLQTPLWLIAGTEVFIQVKDTGETFTGIIRAGTAGVTLEINGNPVLSSSYNITIYPYTKTAFTVAYNDIIDAFTSFYTFTPSVYINDQVSIVSPNSDLYKFYRHDVGAHGNFYEAAVPDKSTLKLIVNPAPLETKVFDNYQMTTESINLSTGANVAGDFFNRIRLYNDYQNTDFQTLPIDTLSNKAVAIRKERSWNISNLRNRVLYTSPDPNIFDTAELSTYTLVTPQLVLGDKVFGERMRDKYLIVDLEYDNTNDYRLVVHSFKTDFRKSAR